MKILKNEQLSKKSWQIMKQTEIKMEIKIYV